MYIIAGHHNYFKSLIVGVIFFAENKQILILPIYAVQTSFLPSLYFLECWLCLWSNWIELLIVFLGALMMRYDLLILNRVFYTKQSNEPFNVFWIVLNLLVKIAFDRESHPEVSFIQVIAVC